ncbi:MAG: thiamine pyrophosphate-binding protein [Acidobacteria bacterium]|nr:thiamine pyrophosphate-binding protein [Acidobacteriota bacterium]
MPTCAEVLAETLNHAGVTRMFGLPGGEILDFIDAGRRCGIEFLLTRHEATASLMADVTGQIQRTPGVCVSTLGPGAVNMTLGVANAYLDRSPLLAITATLARGAEPYATHQKLDLNAVYRPFTKLALTLDAEDTAAKVREAIRVSVSPRMGPVHIALPSDVARMPDRRTGRTADVDPAAPPVGRAPADQVDRVAREIAQAHRPILVLGLDLNPRSDALAVRAFVDRLDLPTFVTPKAKGMLSEDHPRFCGVCAGVAGDPVIVDLFERADLLIGLGFEPVESDKLWHQTMKVVSIGPVSIASDQYRPHAEAVGDVTATIARLEDRPFGPFGWSVEEIDRFRRDLEHVLRPAATPRGLSGYELTRRLRELFPRDTILVTDVGSIKLITTQAWASYEPLTFFESNGLSSMSYAFPGAMAARLQFPERPVLCTIGDGGFSMTFGELETCVRERLHFVTVVFNDSALSLIDVAQQQRGQPTYGVRYGSVDFAAASAALGAWARRVETLEALDAAVADGWRVDRPVVIDAVVDPAEYLAHVRPYDRDSGRGVRDSS